MAPSPPLRVPPAPQPVPWIIRARLLDRWFVLALLWALWQTHGILRQVRFGSIFDLRFPLPLATDRQLIIVLLLSGGLALLFSRLLAPWIVLTVLFQSQLDHGAWTSLMRGSNPDIAIEDLYHMRWDDQLFWLYLALRFVQSALWYGVRRRRARPALASVPPLTDESPGP